MEAREQLAPVLVKVLGLYWLVHGVIAVVLIVTAISQSLAGTVLESGVRPWSLSYELTSGILGVLRPAAYFCAAYVLISKTDWCLEKIGLGAKAGVGSD